MADAPELTEETTAADLMAEHWPLYPLYFAYPQRSVQTAHIARLREEGTLNPDATRAWYLDIVAQLADAEYHVFEESGHCPRYEEPEELVAIVEGWLAKTEARVIRSASADST